MLAGLTIFVNIWAILSVTDANLDDEFSCERFSDVYVRFRNCLQEANVPDFGRTISVMLDSDGVIKADEVLTRLTQVCSDRGDENRDTCVERIVSDCPALAETIHNSVENKISFFCENDNPSSMISEVLQHDFMYNADCSAEDNPAFQVLRTCGEETFSEVEGIDFWNGPMTDAFAVYEELIETWFQCTMQQGGTGDENIFDCGATWQDTVIYFWLTMSGHSYLTPTLPVSLLAQLKDIKA